MGNDSLLNAHQNIIEKCNGSVILLQQNDVVKQIETKILYKQDEYKYFALFDDGDSGQNVYPCLTTVAIANSILSCNVNGFEGEIKWNQTKKIVPKKVKKRKRIEIEPEPQTEPLTEHQ